MPKKGIFVMQVVALSACLLIYAQNGTRPGTSHTFSYPQQCWFRIIIVVVVVVVVFGSELCQNYKISWYLNVLHRDLEREKDRKL